MPMDPDMNIPAPPTASRPSGRAAALDLVNSRISWSHPRTRPAGGQPARTDRAELTPDAQNQAMHAMAAEAYGAGIIPRPAGVARAAGKGAMGDRRAGATGPLLEVQKGQGAG